VFLGFSHAVATTTAGARAQMQMFALSTTKALNRENAGDAEENRPESRL
jgi:hypothetical protein